VKHVGNFDAVLVALLGMLAIAGAEADTPRGL
jgi:hypothetical protein